MSLLNTQVDPIWTNTFHHFDDEVSGMVVDIAGNVFLTGYSEGGFGPRDDDGNFATLAYSGQGIPLWTNRYQGPWHGFDAATAIAAASEGRVYVTGSSERVSGNWDYATIAYSSDGVALWTNCYNVNPVEFPSSLAVDKQGNVFVTGASYVTANSNSWVTIAYSSHGVPLWTNRFGLAIGTSPALALDDKGNVYVSGRTESGFATIKYAASGPPVLTGSVTNGMFKLHVVYEDGGPISVRASTNLAMPMDDWTDLGHAIETTPGQFQFLDLIGTNIPSRFYRVRTP